MGNRPESPVSKSFPFVLIFRTKHGQHAVAGARKFEQVTKPANGIANEETFIRNAPTA
ncbi:hypothetical protein KSB_05320 [Ktedonobacter robiniae]|uniref:Uncharacterized protein n=1 Tax=Ktedonobacter robiniae TaxID=2778365 RepID=A0ABQ3UH70_9CHLR|nr:hypothetical protein KSB_05320 [Ktedonobacter robiniae]